MACVVTVAVVAGVNVVTGVKVLQIRHRALGTTYDDAEELDNEHRATTSNRHGLQLCLVTVNMQTPYYYRSILCIL